MEVINWIDDHHNKNTLLGWFIVEAIAKNKHFFKDNVRFDSKEVYIQFTVNGTPLNIVEVFNDLEKHIENEINERAEKILFENIGDAIHDILDEAIDECREKIKRCCNKEDPNDVYVKKETNNNESP